MKKLGSLLSAVLEYKFVSTTMKTIYMQIVCLNLIQSVQNKQNGS